VCRPPGIWVATRVFLGKNLKIGNNKKNNKKKKEKKKKKPY
jgi:hypothetical protein